MLHRIFLFLLQSTGILLASLLFACGSIPPPPQTPLPTRAQPEDLSHQALANVLSEVDYDLNQARSLLVFLSQAPQVLGKSESECNTFVRQLVRTNPQYTQLGATTPTGELFCDTQERSRTVSVADRLYFSRALTDHNFAIGEYVIGRVTLAPSMGLAYPVLDDSNNFRGVVIAPLKLSYLAQRIAQVDIPVTGEIVILDTYGNLLLRDPDATDWFGKNISDTSLGKAMLGKIQGSGEYAGADGITRFYCFASPSGSNKHLLVAVGIPK